MYQASPMESDWLEVRLFVDGCAAEGAAEALEHCRAARTAIMGRLEPRLRNSLWHSEPFDLLLWDPTVERGGYSEPHLWARMTFGESVDDEWFVVGLLLQLSAEQRDVSIQARDTDGEFLLIEAAECIPRWLKPETSENRVFIRQGALHIIPRDLSPLQLASSASLSLALDDALKYLRSGKLCTRCSEASSVISSRVRVLLEGGSARGPPKHHARCLLPLCAAQLLTVEPQLVAAAAAALFDRTPEAMRSAAKMVNFSARAQSMVAMRVAFPRCRYAQLVSHQFTAPMESGFQRPTSSNPDASAADLGVKVAFGLELLVQAAQAESVTLPASAIDELGSVTLNLEDAVSALLKGHGDAAWDRFQSSLEARGYYRGELEGSRLYTQLKEQAARDFVSRSKRPASVALSWLHRNGSKAISMLSASRPKLPSEETLRAAEASAVSDSDEWMTFFESSLNHRLHHHANLSACALRSEAKVSAPSSQGSDENQQARQLRDAVDSVSDFVGSVSGLEGAELPKARDPKVSLKPDRFLAALAEALGEELPTPFRSSDEADCEPKDFCDMGDDEDSDDDDGNLSASEIDDDSSENADDVTTLQELMAAMDLELRQKQKGPDFELEQHEREGVQPTKNMSQPRATSAVGDETADGDERLVDIDMNLVKNLLASYSSQQGLAGPVSNLLGSMGIQLPDDSDVHGSH